MRTFAVYLLASHSRKLYVGVTSDLRRRVYEHKEGLLPGFTRKYRITKLVHFELTPNSQAAMEREKQIKAWSRKKKIDLIESTNGGWMDLAQDWFDNQASRRDKQDSSLCSE